MQAREAYETEQAQLRKAREGLPEVETMLGLDELQVRSPVADGSQSVQLMVAASSRVVHVRPGGELLWRLLARRLLDAREPLGLPKMPPSPTSDAECPGSSTANNTVWHHLTTANIRVPQLQRIAGTPGWRAEHHPRCKSYRESSSDDCRLPGRVSSRVFRLLRRSRSRTYWMRRPRWMRRAIVRWVWCTRCTSRKTGQRRKRKCGKPSPGASSEQSRLNSVQRLLISQGTDAHCRLGNR